MNDDFTWILIWFANQCNGDWEHGHGIQIGTLDNPGWFFSVNIQETDCEGKEFKTQKIERSENDWFHCFIQNNRFEGACGLYNPPEIFNEILFGSVAQLTEQKSNLNSHFLFPSFADAEKYASLHHKLSMNEEDVEAEEKMKIYEIWRLKQLHFI